MSEDHFHWLTALLSANDLARPLCRLIGVSAFFLGILPVVLVAEGSGPHGPTRLGVSIAVALCSTFVAVLWVTRCWPTRRQSRVSVVTVSVGVAVAVIVIPDSLTGALAALSFSGPIGFAALFHSRRLFLGICAVGAVTLTGAGWRLASDGLLVAVTVLSLIVTTNALAGLACWAVVRLAATKVPSAQTDPLTGLLNRSAFDERIATILGARDRAQDRHLAIAVIGLDVHDLLMGLDRRAEAERTCVAAARQLRNAARRDAVLAYRGGGDFIMAELLTSAHPGVMLERLSGTLTERPARVRASIGAVTTPLAPLSGHPANDVLDELLHLADQARLRARRTGGDATRCTINPTLAILHDPPGA